MYVLYCALFELIFRLFSVQLMQPSVVMFTSLHYSPHAICVLSREYSIN